MICKIGNRFDRRLFWRHVGEGFWRQRWKGLVE